MTQNYICKSTLSTWQVIEIFDTGVPEDVLAALESEQQLTRRTDSAGGSVYSLMWDDMLVYHGEDGWVLDDTTLGAAETWLENIRKEHGLDERSAFWFRIKRS